jgi:hypothetical protein
MTRDALRSRTAARIPRWTMRFSGPASMFAILLCFELIAQFDDLLRPVHSIVKVA